MTPHYGPWLDVTSGNLPTLPSNSIWEVVGAKPPWVDQCGRTHETEEVFAAVVVAGQLVLEDGASVNDTVQKMRRVSLLKSVSNVPQVYPVKHLEDGNNVAVRWHDVEGFSNDTY